jgi:hypothetical protein
MKYDIPSHLISEYIFSKFTDYKLYTEELVTQSPFPDSDEKPRFSINLETGLWRVFGASCRQGNIFHLYSFLEDVTYKEAVKRLLYKSLEDINLCNSEPIQEEVCYQYSQIPKDWVEVSIDSWEDSDPDIQRAFGYLLQRDLFYVGEGEPPQKFYIQHKGLLSGRVIIPLMEEGDMFFWTARDIVGNGAKYMHSPSKDYTKASHILYPFDYEKDYVIICEGIFDVIALQNQGINATCVFGANVSQIQLEMLKEFGGKLIAGFDADDAGMAAIKRLEKARKKLGMPSFLVSFPPKGYKDWSEAHEAGLNLMDHITQSSEIYDFYYITLNSL